MSYTKTTEEAKKCICPMSFPLNGNLNVVVSDTTCKADKCMAWRWETFAHITPQGRVTSIEQTGKGYCGLACRDGGG